MIASLWEETRDAKWNPGPEAKTCHVCHQVCLCSAVELCTLSGTVPPCPGCLHKHGACINAGAAGAVVHSLPSQAGVMMANSPRLWLLA